MKITMPALLLSLASLHACVESEELAEQQQAEIIEVHGCRPGFLEVGEGDNWTCILDPWWGRGAGGGGEGGESGGGGGGGGGGAGRTRAEARPEGMRSRAGRAGVSRLLLLQPRACGWLGVQQKEDPRSEEKVLGEIH